MNTYLTKLITRTHRFVQEIRVTGDSPELRFYDDAEIDGDSIAVLINDKMLAEHIPLSGAGLLTCDDSLLKRIFLKT